jgi:hypothetical protein
MPQRDNAHVVGDRAAQRIALVWTDVGAAVEHVFKDYGDDLCVQPSLRGKMDDCRIWVQSKGSTDVFASHWRPTLGVFRVGIENDLLARWARFADEVVVVLWDVNRNEGWFALPNDQTDELDLLMSPAGQSQISLSRGDIFNEDAARMLMNRAHSRSAGRRFEVVEWKIMNAAEFDDAEDLARLRRVRHSVVMNWILDSEIMERHDNAGNVRFSERFLNLFGSKLGTSRIETADLFQPVFDAIVEIVSPGEIHEGLLSAAIEIVEVGLTSTPRDFAERARPDIVPSLDMLVGKGDTSTIDKS